MKVWLLPTGADDARGNTWSFATRCEGVRLHNRVSVQYDTDTHLP